MEMKKILSTLLVVVILGAIAIGLKALQPEKPPVVISSFDECVMAGNPVMESYPRQCAADGKTFVEEIEIEIPPKSPIEEVKEGLGLQANGCAVAGCSGQVCVSADEAGNIITTCEFRAEYACYKEASCEPQADGKCGWTQTEELTSCLSNPPALEQ